MSQQLAGCSGCNKRHMPYCIQRGYAQTQAETLGQDLHKGSGEENKECQPALPVEAECTGQGACDGSAVKADAEFLSSSSL